MGNLRAPHHLFANLPDALARQMFASATPVRLAPEQTLFVAGDPGDGCYCVDEGLLKVTVIAPSGAERILAILGAGAVVGELAVIDGRPRSATVMALRESQLGHISRAAFEGFAQRHPEVYRHVTTVLAHRLRDANAAVAATSFLPLKGRVARALLALAEAFGKDVGAGRMLIRQKLTQSDVAAMAGIARENASRILTEWTRAKIVSRLSGYYCLDDRAALEKEAEL